MKLRYSLILFVAALAATPAESRPRQKAALQVSLFDGGSITPMTEFQPISEPRRATQRPVRQAGTVIGGRPSGCPSRYCGCSASLYLFGKIIPSLNLAANWLRFPRATPAPRMAAARRGHVFVLVEHRQGNVWLVHDGNSGGRLTRLHERSIAGFAIVNPNG